MGNNSSQDGTDEFVADLTPFSVAFIESTLLKGLLPNGSTSTLHAVSGAGLTSIQFDDDGNGLLAYENGDGSSITWVINQNGSLNINEQVGDEFVVWTLNATNVDVDAMTVDFDFYIDGGASGTASMEFSYNILLQN